MWVKWDFGVSIFLYRLHPVTNVLLMLGITN